jgi:hypothetical protein
LRHAKEKEQRFTNISDPMEWNCEIFIEERSIKTMSSHGHNKTESGERDSESIIEM